MSATIEEDQYRLDGLKWCAVMLLISGAVYGNYYFSVESLFYRAVAMVVVGLAVAFVAINTRKGNAFKSLLQGAYAEARRVVWPTRQDRNQTTLMVVVVVFLMSLILWGLDTLFGWLASMVIS